MNKLRLLLAEAIASTGSASSTSHSELRSFSLLHHIHERLSGTMASADWHESLGFATRLSAVTKIATAYQRSGPSISAADAHKEATIIETRIYDEAQSTEDYELICEAKIESFKRPPLELPTVEDTDPVPTSDGMDIGKYKNATYYREGLFSAVYRAAALEHEQYFAPKNSPKTKLVALKVTTPSTMEPPHDSKREARILQLSASNHVIPLLESFREAGTHFVLVFPFMPYALDQLFHDRKLSKEQIRSCLRDLFSALTFVHEREVIHRDVKPSNILLKSLDGPAYLSDFGIAWAPDVPGAEPADSKITDVGTTCYRPPELLFGNKRYGNSLDLWAAGCTVAEAVIQDHPTLFDSGELGSDLALIQSMFKKLGTPDLTVWPEAASLPDWGKVQFHEYPAQSWSSLLPNVADAERDLVGNLVRYESGARMTAAQALQHPYFTEQRDARGHAAQSSGSCLDQDTMSVVFRPS